MKEVCDDAIDSSTFAIVPSSCNTHSPTYIRELWRPLHCVHDRKGGENRREWYRVESHAATRGMKKRETTTRAADRQWRVPLYPRHDSALTTAHQFTITVVNAAHERSDLISSLSLWSTIHFLRANLPSRLPSYLILPSISFTRDFPHPCLLFFSEIHTARSFLRQV